MAGQVVVIIGDKEWSTDVAILPWEFSQGLSGLEGLLSATGMFFDLGIKEIVEVATMPMLSSLISFSLLKI